MHPNVKTYMHKKPILRTVLFVIYMIQSSITVAQNTYYVDVNVANDYGDGSINSPKKHVQSAIDLMSTTGGDTVIIQPGIYANTNDAIIDPPSGTASSYNIIKAAIDGTVIISGIRDHPINSYYTNNNLYFSSSAYVQIEGLHFKGKGIKGGDGAYIKFFRTSFDDGPNGNEYVFSSGGSYILLEDCFFYGPGGRQALAFYEADHIIVRRAVIRHDHGWHSVDGKEEPTGVATIYNSNFVEFQNVILLDSYEDPLSVGSNFWAGGVSFASNGPSNTENTIRGLISINVQGTTHNFGGYGNIGPVSIYDEAVYADPSLPYSGYALVVMNNGGGNLKTATIDKATIVNYNTMVSLFGGPNFETTITNSIGQAITQVPFVINDGNNVLGSYNNCNGCEHTGSTSYDAAQNGLLYLPRIETGSILATAGENGSQMGATIVNRIGVSGTLYGETGYNIETNQPLWPYPYEARIKKEMCEDMGETRGFCAAGNGLNGNPITLTSYIWEVLGNPCPSNIYGTLSVDEEKLSTTVLLIPNPTSDIFVVETSEHVLDKVVIYNTFGQQVLEATLNKVNVSGLPSGSYFVKLLMKNGTVFYKKLLKD